MGLLRPRNASVTQNGGKRKPDHPRRAGVESCSSQAERVPRQALSVSPPWTRWA